ncbi:MAG: hypothetical protein J6X53_05430, partial [Abditibacteriota bacterium]|nr:hypothetical protein [Abditibacteriota bacterium]
RLLALTIHKRDSVSGEPLEGAEFAVKEVGGQEIGTFVTGADGTAEIAGLLPGMSVSVKETKAPAGYVQSTAAQSVKMQSGRENSVTFENVPLQSVTIQKLIQGTNKPLAGVVFLVTDGNGAPVGGNGEYVTDDNGRITITGLTPGMTLVAREIRTVKGYVLNGSPQTIIVGSGSATLQSVSSTGGAGASGGSGTAGTSGNSMTFYDEPLSKLIVRKVIDGTSEPLAGVVFRVVDSSGAAVGTSGGEFTTDEAGTFTIENLEPGVTLQVREIRTAEGFVLENAVKTVKINSSDVHELVFRNKRAGSLAIQSLDSLTNLPIPGVEFKVLYADGRPVDTSNGQQSSGGQYFTDANGEIHITGIVGTIVATEERPATGYTMDANNRRQTIVVNPGETQTLTFKDIPDQALIVQLYVEGTTTPIPNAQFLLTDSAGQKLGEENGIFTTDSNGRFTLAGIKPGVTVKIKQITTSDGYLIDGEAKIIAIKSGDAQTVTVFNPPKQTLTVRLFVKDTTTPIEGAKFLLRDSGGNLIGDANGVFTTDNNGEFTVNNLVPGVTITATQTDTITGYLPDG